MWSGLDVVLIVGALFGILSSSTMRLASGLPEATECAGQLGPVSGSTTKPQVTWRLENASTGVVNVVVSRYVAYSGTFKYVSIAFASNNQMPSTNLIVDCYEKSSGTQIATSRNVNYTNLPDSTLNSRIWSTSARRVGTNLSCSFSAKIQPDAKFIFMATGAMSEGLKSKHAEKYIFATSDISCLLEAAAPIVMPSTASASRSMVPESTTVKRASDLTGVPPTAASDFSPFRTQPEDRISAGSLRSIAALPITARTLTPSTTPRIEDVTDADYSAIPEPADAPDASSNKQAPSTSVAITRALGSSAKNGQQNVLSTARALLPDAVTTASVATERETRNSSLPDSAAPGPRKELVKNTASSDVRMPWLLCLAACLCAAFVQQFAGGDTLLAMQSLWEMLAMNTA